MGDHFVLLVDRLLTESTLEAAIENRNRSIQLTSSGVDDIHKDNMYSQVIEFGNIESPKKLVECRICQDEDDNSNMESPCSCCGSLKYAHRRCVQRWCDEKGDTTCEICHEPYKPDYTSPSPPLPPLFQIGRIPMNFRGNWEISRNYLNSPDFIATHSTDRNLTNLEEDSASTTRSLLCCRSVAIIFMILMILRHTLPLIFNDADEYALPLFFLMFLRTAGIVLPIYIMVRAVTASTQRRRYHGSSSSSNVAHNSTLQHLPPPPPNVIHLH